MAQALECISFSLGVIPTKNKRERRTLPQPWLPELPFGGWAGSGPLIAGTVGIAKPGKYPAPGAAALIPDHLHLLPRDNEAVLFPLASSGKAIPDKQIIVWNISSMCSSAALPASQSQLDLL